MANVKISEMEEASQVISDDYIPIVQQGVNKKAKVKLIKTTIVDNLESDSATDGLSAKQGKKLNEKIAYKTGCVTAGISSYNWDGTIDAYGILKIGLNTISGNTDKLTLQDNGIKIGAGISKIKISGQAGVYRGTTGSYGARIMKNDELAAFTSGSFTDWNTQIYAIPPKIIKVTENDIISLYLKSGANASSKVSITDASAVFYLTVEIVE